LSYGKRKNIGFSDSLRYYNCSENGTRVSKKSTFRLLRYTLRRLLVELEVPIALTKAELFDEKFKNFPSSFLDLHRPLR
jgi:hypothetical protein